MPLILWGLFLAMVVVHVSAVLIGYRSTPATSATPAGHGSYKWLFNAEGWVVISASLSLFLLYFVVASRKRVSNWWLLFAFCGGLNVVAYVLLLLKRGRPRPADFDDEAQQGFYFPTHAPALTGYAWRPVSRQLETSFVCDTCNSLLNYGVTECSHCGERFRYEEGVPMAEVAVTSPFSAPTSDD